ncbi:MAG: hypothetical protein LBI10_07265 [Deltaproteobacteria bacterium]|jgi:hypothetical protein|nr:hypothetical protein [Deltaproteobacteria bacterium]
MLNCINKLFDNYFLENNVVNILSTDINIDETFNLFSYIFDKYKDNNTFTTETVLKDIVFPVINRLGWTQLTTPSSQLPNDYPLFWLVPKNQPNLSADKGPNLESLTDLALKTPLAVGFGSRPTFDEPTTGADLRGREPKSDDLRSIDLFGLKKNPFLAAPSLAVTGTPPHGFWTNGWTWLYWDDSLTIKPESRPLFFLDQILAQKDLAAFRLFVGFFAASSHVEFPARPAKIKVLSQKNQKRLQEIETDLLDQLVGLNVKTAILTEIGQILSLTKGDFGPPSPRETFENSLRFILRLFFIACFEAKYPDAYRLAGLSSLSLKDLVLTNWPDPQGFEAFWALKKLFQAFDPQSSALGFTPYALDLFTEEKSPKLADPSLFPNASLSRLLKRLLTRPQDGAQHLGDFSYFSLNLIGRIYERLLDFEFRLVPFDLPTLTLTTDQNPPPDYPQGQLRLMAARFDRKSGGGYYTPLSLAWPLVRRGLASRLNGSPPLGSLLDLTVLDCASGAGQLILLALEALASLALDRLETDAPLRRAFDQEIAALTAHRQNLKPDLTEPLNEFTVLKRLLLKNLYAVDVDPFAILLTKGALWLETFVYLASPALIEPRVLAGDSLLGTSSELDWKNDQTYLFSRKIEMDLKKLAQERALLFKDNDHNPAGERTLRAKFQTEIRPLAESLTTLIDQDFAKGPGLKNAALINLKYFHWPVAFPEIFDSTRPGGPGFSLIVGNPPWDKVKFEDPLFFAQSREDYRILSVAEKKRVAQEILADPQNQEKYQKEKARVESYKATLKAHYPCSQRAGDLNLFRFFVERALSLLAKGGVLSYLLPLAILTDDGSAAIRRHILQNYRLSRVDGFENKGGVFPEVHDRYKYGLILIENGPDLKGQTLTRFMLTDPKDLESDQGLFPYPKAVVEATSPERWAYFETKGGLNDLLILQKLYALFPPLDPIWLDFRRELDATFDKKIFYEAKKPGFLPLYKGETIWLYQAPAAPVRYYLDPVEFDQYLASTALARLKNDLKSQLARVGTEPRAQDLTLLLGTDQDLIKFLVPERTKRRLAFRAIASDTNERTLISAILPPNVGAQNSLWLSIPGRYRLNLAQRTVEYAAVSLKRLLFVQALFNSLVVDWLLRASVAMNVNKTFISRLPLPQPTDLDLETDPTLAEIVADSALLSLFRQPDLRPLLVEMADLDLKASPATTADFEGKMALLDLKVARLYQVSKKEMTHVLAGFKVLKAKKPHYWELIQDLSQTTLEGD